MNNRGSVLIIVLWGLFFLAMLAVAVHAYVMPYVELSGRLLGRTQMYYFANAGAERAIFEVENDNTELYDSLHDLWSHNDAAFSNVAINGGIFSVVKDETVPGEPPQYGLTDEERKISLNKAPQQVLKNLFEKGAEVEPDEADAIADLSSIGVTKMTSSIKRARKTIIIGRWIGLMTVKTVILR